MWARRAYAHSILMILLIITIAEVSQVPLEVFLLEVVEGQRSTWTPALVFH